MVSEGRVSLQRVDVQNRWTVSSCVAATLALALGDDLLGPGFEPLALGELEDSFPLPPFSFSGSRRRRVHFFCNENI